MQHNLDRRQQRTWIENAFVEQTYCIYLCRVFLWELRVALMVIMSREAETLPSLVIWWWTMSTWFSERNRLSENFAETGSPGVLSSAKSSLPPQVYTYWSTERTLDLGCTLPGAGSLSFFPGLGGVNPSLDIYLYTFLFSKVHFSF